MDSYRVLLQALDGRWEECGIDRLRGIVPEGIQASANESGSDTIRFTLRRDPGAVHPDLTAYTPCEYWEAGEKVWSGRVWETPTKDGSDASISVEGRGWQYHLDDDVLERMWVHTKLGDWKDARTSLDANLTILASAGTVSSDNGALILGYANGAVYENNRNVGVTLDLGPYSTAERIVLVSEFVNGSGDFTFRIRGHDTEDFTASGTYEEVLSVAHSAGGGEVPRRGTFTTARRYVTLFMAGSAGGTATADILTRVTSAKVFRDTAYESGDESVLKSSDLVTDAIDAGTILLSSDRTGIEDSTFDWPEFALDGLKSPREIVGAANAAEDRIFQIDVDGRPVFKDKPTYPIFEIGNWSGSEFEDASANSGEEIYNRVVVEGTGPDGSALRVERKTVDLSGVGLETLTLPSISNQSFDVNASGWFASSGTLTRDTGVFHTTPASGRWDKGSDFVSGDELFALFSGSFTQGRTYRLLIAVRVASGHVYDIVFGDNPPDQTVERFTGTGAFQQHELYWAPRHNYGSGPAISVVSRAGSAASTLYVDSVATATDTSSLVSRRGFRRTKILPVRSALTTALANQIGDTYLLGHQSTPLKGGLNATKGGVRRVLGGAPVHPAHLLKHTQQMLRLAHRIDPDTGGHGRDGRIAAVAWDRDKGEANVTLDNERTNFEALLERLAVVVGGA